MKCVTIGVAGTAKNTGKTTTAIVIIREAYRNGIPLGLTGIGYDGEEIDNVTLLPKPRYYVPKGTIVATAKGCMHVGSAILKALTKTGIHTALGEVIISKVKEAGTVLIAGANTGKGLNFVIRKLKDLGRELIIVDGAINRIAPLIVVDGLILTTGAAREIKLDVLAREMRQISKIFSLPEVDQNLVTCRKDTVAVLQKDNEKWQLPFSSLLATVSVEELIKKIDQNTRLILIPGIVEERIFRGFVRKLGKEISNKIVVFHDPTKLLVSGPEIAETLTEIESLGNAVKYLKKLPLIAVTVNPFYPKYSHFYQNYEPAYVDKDELLLKISESTHVPVIDVLAKSGDRLLKIIYSTLLA